MRSPTPIRTRLMAGASLVCLGMFGAGPASAQLAALKAAAAMALHDLPANAIPAPGANLGSVSLVRDQGSAVARQLATQMRLANSVGLITQAQAAARGAAAALASTVPNGLVAGGLQLAPNLKSAARDAGGLNTYQGALAPTQTTSGGATTVDVTQTASRAVLSWTTFNVGKDTTVNFDQKANGVVQKDWVAFNRVVGQLDPATGRRDPTLAPAPSQILGRLHCDASCVVINANGVFFSGTSQVNAGSLLVSTLEIGANSVVDTTGHIYRTTTIAERNKNFIITGLLSAVSGSQSAQSLSFAPAGVAAAPDSFGGVAVFDEKFVEGDIKVAAGADLSVGDAGALLLAAPHIVNAGSLGATNGSVLLGAGRAITVSSSTGSTATGGSADVRGLYISGATVNVADADPGSYIQNAGIISVPRGLIDLRTDTGAIFQQGVLSATTSVSRNGFVDLLAPDIQLAPNSTIAVTPDTGGETIPQSPASVAAFKTSRVSIGGIVGGAIASTGASAVNVGANSLIYAPGGRVGFGDADQVGLTQGQVAGPPQLARLFVDTGAIIDVGGVKDFVVPATRNQVTISPAKRNELRDTPNYRQSFLNGSTIYVDPRRSGVRADGVAWVGSPLVEAGSYYQQIGITAAELSTRGGSVNVGTVQFAAGSDPALAPSIIVKPGARIDVSGGWVRYAAGQVQTSQLITRGGQIVDIGNADPNGDYVGLVNPFTTTNTRFGITESFPNATLQGITTVGQYTEGRDAGTLSLNAPTIALDGSVYGQAYAGSLQRATAAIGTRAPSVAGDVRKLQSVPSQLPQGAMLAINPGGDILVTTPLAITPISSALVYGQLVSLDSNGALVRPTMRDPASLLSTDRTQTIALGDATLSAMGLGQLTLDPSGSLTFAKGSVTTLAPGGALTAFAGRRVLIDGAVSAPGGTINISTAGLAFTEINSATSPTGSLFHPDIPGAGAFDVTVNGTLSTAGRFVNDLGLAPEQADGGAYTNGGSISISVAPRVSTLIGAAPNTATDISGSILINPGALIDVSGGSYVGATGAVSTSSRGGDLTLVNATTYSQIAPTLYSPVAVGSVPGLRFSFAPPFDPVAVPNPPSVDPTTFPFNPTTINARVAIAPGSIRAHGFAGGGALNLTTPAFDFGNVTAITGTQLPMDFLSKTGFASATVNVLKTSLFVNRFVNQLGGYNALLSTNTITIGAGQTLDLTQSGFSRLLTSDQVLALQATPTGGSLYGVLTPGIPVSTYDQRPIALTLAGLTELDVTSGGRVIGAPGALLTAAKLFDQGMIRLPGGSVTATERLPSIYVSIYPTTKTFGVRALSEVFATSPNGDIVETDLNLAGVTSNQTLQVLTNRDFALLHTIYLLGRLDQNEGIRVAPGGVIDVSGASIRNPRAISPTGAPIVDGRLLDGGTVQSSSRLEGVSGIALPGGDRTMAATIAGETLNALPGSTINISGASDSYARFDSTGIYVSTPQWSNAGTLGLRAGGTIAGATIIAAGGAPQATGGTLIVRDLLLSQADPTVAGTGAISATQIAGSGFDTVVAEGSLNTVGDVGLSLRRAFIVQSTPDTGQRGPTSASGVTIGATGALNVSAPFIRFASVQQRVADLGSAAPGTASAAFNATALDVQGAVLFDPSLASVTLRSAGDLRLIGVQPYGNVIASGTTVPNSLTGQLVTSGDLTLAAAQIYPTTGTGVGANPAGDPRFVVASASPTGTIRFARTTTTTPATPYSAGTGLLVQAANIEQGGVLRAPLGGLTLGSNAPLMSTTLTATVLTLAPATASLHLAKGGVTSVSADGLSIPYGITTDQVEYFFSPTVAAALTAPPAALLTLNGGNVALDTGATVNLKGGGDVYAYEFVPGIGGSRDVLSRSNPNPFSSNTGFQYPDARQVYAIVPGLRNAGLAAVDPIYSADYGALTSASQVGRSVYLSAAPGLAAGYYTLLPAQYALLPGGLRVVEQPEYGIAVPGRSTLLRDGTIVTGGYYATAGTDLRDSVFRTFAVQTQATFKNASQLATTSADTVFPARAARNGLTSPRIPLDAGRLVIGAITGITAKATFETAAATGGRASATDIAGTNFLIVGNASSASSPAPAPGTIVVTTGTLAALNSASLLIGGTRTDNADGTTSLVVSANSIAVANDGTTTLTAPELLFAVAGPGSSISLADGSSVAASGALGDTRVGDYLLDGASGAGALLRLSSGAERVARRTNVATGVTPPPLLSVGLAHLASTSLLLDSSGDLNIASPATGAADIAAKQIAIGAGAVAFAATAQPAGLTITPQLQSAFAKAATLTIRSPRAVSFAAGSYNFGALTLDTPALALLGDPGAVTLSTGALRLQSSAVQLATCAPACGAGTLGVTASTISFGSGQIRTAGFGGGVSLTAPGGVTFDGADDSILFVTAVPVNPIAAVTNGAAGLDAGTAPLVIATPFLGDRALPLLPGKSAVLPRLALATSGALTLTGVAGATVAAVAAAGTPGARLAFGGDTVSITDTQVVATAGTLDVRGANGIALAGTASLATPGYSKVFGDAADPTTVSAPGGLLRLTAANGAIKLGQNTRLSVGGAQGKAGELRLVAANGAVDANGILDAAAPGGGGLFTLVSRGGFDLGKFAGGAAKGFDQRIDIRTGTGDLALGAGQRLTSRVVKLTADGGADSIAGTIDTSGVNGGQIALYGANGVTLAATGKLLARARGYGANDSRQAKGGDVTIGTDGGGAIALAAGSTIDVSAARPGDRLVADVRAGVTYYRLALGDQGGTLSIRAPIVGAAGANTVNVGAAGTVVGARDVRLEAFRRFDLAAIAANGGYSGVTDSGGTAILDAGAVGAGQVNFLADLAPGTIPDFVQNFSIAAAAPKLTGLGRYRARPGIELDYAGTIQVGTLTTTTDANGVVQTSASNWNLGAGTVDIAAAMAAGDMMANPAQPGAVYVVPGREADVFQRFTTLTYRVGGKVDGEPGVLTLRAGGTLDIKGSITDGFFAFRDQTTPDAISYAYGGGNRLYNPVLQPACADLSCAGVIDFNPAGVFDPTMNTITLGFASLATVDRLIPFSYNAAANSPSAPGGFGMVSGDPLGTAEIFPRLATPTGSKAVDSWAYTLVGGADLAASGGRPSANPLAVNAAVKANVVVEGETSYAVAPVGGLPATFTGNLQILNNLQGTSPTATNLSGFVAQFIANRGISGVVIDAGSATQLTLAGPGGATDPIGTFLNASAASFFAPGQATFGTDASGNPVVTTRLDLAGAFLQSIAVGYGQLIASGAAGVTPPPSPQPTPPVFATNYVRTRVRTGTGDIAVAASGDIDISNGPAINRLSQQSFMNPNNVLQVGGTSIYTAGARADLGARFVADPSGAGALTLDPAAYLATGSIFTTTDFSRIQPVQDALAADPLYLAGGGDVSLVAGGDVFGRRDVQGGFRGPIGFGNNTGVGFIGTPDQPYRVGQISGITNIQINPQLFQTGVATLGGGAITIGAGGNLSDLTVVSNTSVTTADVTGGGTQPTRALVTVGGGDVRLSAGRDVASGLFDIGSGALTLRAAGDLTTTTGSLLVNPAAAVQSNSVRVRVADATARLDIGGQATVRNVSAFGVGATAGSVSIGAFDPTANAPGFYTPVAGFAITSNASFTLEDYGAELPGTFGGGFNPGQAVLPGSFAAISLTGDLQLAPTRTFQLWLSPSPIGQLTLFAGGNITPVAITMSDGDPGLLPGYFSTFATGSFPVGTSPQFPAVLSTTTDSDRRLQHNSSPTHAGDAQPVRIAAGGDIDTLRLSTPKQTRVFAGRDLLDAAVFAQNLAPSDISRVVAGRDVIGTTILGQNYVDPTGFTGPTLPITRGNVFVIGGPGSLFVEAGRDAGPFLTSVTATAFGSTTGSAQTLGGGIMSVGNDWNPWLAPVGANIVVQFGVGKGVNYAGLRDAYVDPANVAALPDELFAQNVDRFNRSVADRGKPIYAPILTAWTRANAAAELTAAYGTTDVTVAQAYAVFKALPELRQREFLIEDVYFNELKQTSIPTSVSYLKYARGYRAVNLLYPPSYGYTANDLSGGGGTGTVPVETGNLDLRLATIQTTRGGTIDIMGPGGRVLGGSTVRTDAQAARRLTIAERVYDGLVTNGTVDDNLFPYPAPTSIDSIPTGLEGIITLRGGAVNGFVDQNFLLNQSRLFTQAGGNVELWSSNGDLNAGQGPKTSANFPPVVVRVGPNGTSEVDAIGGVTGAGIAAFQPAPGTPPPDVFLIAPRGTVDAGDAGVRVAGNLFVAALAVANADNFAVGGTAFGLPSGPVVNVAATSAAGAATAAAIRAADATSRGASTRRIDPLSRIVVDVLGYYGSSDPCDQVPRPKDCPAPRK